VWCYGDDLELGESSAAGVRAEPHQVKTDAIKALPGPASVSTDHIPGRYVLLENARDSTHRRSDDGMEIEGEA
jgi:hypothetical protein